MGWGAVFYILSLILVLLAGQTLILLHFREPLQWTYGASSSQPHSVRRALKIWLQTVLIGSIFLYPHLIGSSPAVYFAPLFRADLWFGVIQGEIIALLLLGLIFVLELQAGWIHPEMRFTPGRAVKKCLLSALSSITVVLIEESLFRGILLKSLLDSGLWPPAAILVSAVLFSAAHFIRKVPTYWPAVGLAVLGLWLGVAFYRTGALWLPMGLHSGGILAIGIHRCFTRYTGDPLIIGTQTFPIAGAISIGVMLAGTLLTWFLFP